ncbi:MAG: DOMON domain-containing protein [Candidatus Tyrphobacter sp.]
MAALTLGRAQAAVTATFSFPVARAPHALALDPALRDPAWSAGRVPNGGAWENITTRSPANERTQAYVLYDDRYLYVAFRVEQRGTPITATQTVNDVGFGIDDFVGIGVDPSGAGSEDYYFETTPLATRYQQANENVRFRPRWRSAAARTPGGWNAVMIVPLDVLHVPHAGTQTWRFQFVRSIAAKGEHYAWAYNGIMQDFPAGQWPAFVDARFWAAGTLHVVASAASRPQPRADAYLLESVGRDRNLFEQPDQLFLPQSVRHYGIDVSVPLTSTIDFVGTLNPDFSNVEVDQETIAPQEFRRQLVEYRPFFAQGAVFVNAASGMRTTTGSFSTGQNVIFYSPSVGAFDRGGKVEGSFGDQSFGIMSFRGFDATTGSTFDDEAFGYEHALQDNSFLYWTDGVLAHHSLAGDDSTVEGGVETRNLKTGLITFADYSFESGTWVPNGRATMFETFADVHKPNYEVNVGYLDIAPNYNPIDGYTANSDIRGPQSIVDFTGGSSPGIKSWSAFIEGDRFLDESGAVHQADTGVFANVVFTNGLSLDGLGPAIGELRSYAIPSGADCTGPTIGVSYFTGYPCYRGGVTQAFNLMNVPVDYGDATPNPINTDYAWGTFGSNEVHLFTLSMTRVIGDRLTLGVDYDGTYERPLVAGPLTSQWLRRISLGYSVATDSTLTVALRSINGYGGFAPAVGTDLAIAYQQRFHNGDQLYVNYGTPAAAATLDRLIVKFVFHAGADTGT